MIEIPASTQLMHFSNRPFIPRVYDFLLGGSDSYVEDRELAAELYSTAPWLWLTAWANLCHRPKAVRVLAGDLGIRQFIDLGCGLPTRWSTARYGQEPEPVYEAALKLNVDPRVVYVDADPIVCGHARMMLDEYPGRTAVAQGDVWEIDKLLDHPTIAHLDRGRPIGVLLHDLLPWVDHVVAERVMVRLRECLPPGSAISVTHDTSDEVPKLENLVGIYATAGIRYEPRSAQEITDLLRPGGRWDLLPPGTVPTHLWRPGRDLPVHHARERLALAVGRAAVISKRPAASS
ncbi:SAM-dependent methyltransferase [Streptomyces achromogenes]|uniref:SAM-dependent methyltransferase n=1 Tax=Streptomyces achromogenes TaxID=67255 RepID=UPI003697BFC3